MTREQLAHLLRSAAQIADESDVVVIGSQSILGTYAEDELPAQAVASLEADLAFFDDDDNAKSDSVDAHIGEESRSTTRSATRGKVSASPLRSCRQGGGTASSCWRTT